MTFLEYTGLMRKLKNAEAMKEDDGKYTCLLQDRLDFGIAEEFQLD